MVAATVVFLVVLLAPVRGWDRHISETAAWMNLMVFSNTGEGLANQPQRAFWFGNQSLMSVVHRLTRPVDAGVDRDDETLKVNLVDIGPRGSFVVLGRSGGGSAYGMCWRCRRGPGGRGRATGSGMRFCCS